MVNKTTFHPAANDALKDWVHVWDAVHGLSVKRSEWAHKYGRAAQVVATEADRLNRERLVVVPVVVALSGLGAIDAIAVGGLGQCTPADRQADSGPSVPSSSCLAPAPMAFKALLGMVVTATDVGTAMNTEAHVSDPLYLAGHQNRLQLFSQRVAGFCGDSSRQFTDSGLSTAALLGDFRLGEFVLCLNVGD